MALSQADILHGRRQNAAYSFALKESKGKIEVPGLHSGGRTTPPRHEYKVFRACLDKDRAICGPG